MVAALPELEPVFHSAVPHYLLERGGHGVLATGGVLCVPGTVRDHVSAEDLDAWSVALCECSMCS